MRLSLRQLQIFTSVAETGSTTAASGALSLSQSAASGALGQLEGLLRAHLFDRVGKRLVLNDNGRALLPQARALLDGAQSIEQQFGAGLRSRAALPVVTRLRVGASTTIGNYVLPAMIASYCTARPEARFDVQIANTGEIARLVMDLKVDFGLVEGPCPEGDLAVDVWRDDTLAIVCAPGHPLAGRRSTRVSLAELRREQWLLREAGSGTRAAVELALLPHLHRLKSEMQFGGTEAIKQATAAGLGITCLSTCAVQDFIALGRLVELKTTLRSLSRPFYLIHHRQKQLSAGIAQFLEHCATA